MKCMPKTASRRGGFSLAELMVVIVIIGLLATMVVPRLMDQFGDAQVTKAKADINTLNDALLAYMMKNRGTYPDTLEALVTPDENNRKFIEQDTLPKDPWGMEYVYYPPQGGNDHIIMSLGKDKREGGEGADRDITLRDIKNGDI